jgi:hypothetical protein
MSLEIKGDQAGAADFYYGEMEMRRLDRSTPTSERLLLHAYWLTSAYGLRAFRSLLMLILFIGLGAIGMESVGIANQKVGVGDALIAAGQSALPGISVGTARKLTNWGEAIDLLLTVAGPVLLALVALSVRNRLRR